MPIANVNGIKLNYNVVGEGKPVVLITGFAGTMQFWNSMVSLLSDDHKVVTLDNRGVGMTEYKGQFDTDDMADDVIALMDHLSIGRAHIVGWSMGTTISHRIALRYPERVASMTFVSAYSKRPARSSYVMNAAIRAVKEGADFDVFSMMLNGMCYGETAFTTRERKGSRFKLPAPSRIEGIEDQMRVVDTYDGRYSIKDIPFDVLVIHGKEDVMVPPWIGERIADAITNSKIVWIPDAGHIIHPSTYINSLKDHIAKH